jgi:K+-transporting ATPase c subunit
MSLVHRFTGGRGLGFSGEPSVNVMELNLAIAQRTGATR